MKTDEISRKYSGRKVNLSLKLMDEEECGLPTVLIEGPPDALKMLAELLIAVAEESANDGFSISPSGAGSVHFAKSSKLGIYLHRIDVLGE